MDAAAKKKKPLTQGNLDQTEARLRQLRHDMDDAAIKAHGRTALVLKKHGASDSLAAQLLGVDRKTLYRKLEKYGSNTKQNT